MDAKTARDIVDKSKGTKTLDKETKIQLEVQEWLSEIKYQSQSGVSELVFNPDNHKTEVRRRLEDLNFAFDKRTVDGEKIEYITW